MRGFSLRGSPWFALAVLMWAEAASVVNGQQSLNVSGTVGTTTPDWTVADSTEQSSTSLNASVNPSPTPPSGCKLRVLEWGWWVIDTTDNQVQYSPDGSTWSPASNGSYSGWIVQPDPYSPPATLNVTYTIGGYWQFPCKINAEQDDSPCGDTWLGSAVVTAQAKSVKLLSLTVTSGATQTNVTGATNWAAVKTKVGDSVIAQAKIQPNNQDAAAQIQWTGGNAVAGDLTQRSVDKGTSAMTTVTAKIGGDQYSVNIWILWATIQILTANPKPANAPKFGPGVDDGTENLGAVMWNNGNTAAGKICAVGTITPAGVHNVVQAGWNFRRDMWRHDFADGTKINSRYDSTWQGDDSKDTFKTSTPDNTDKIYDIDGPSIGDPSVPGLGKDSYERYDNYREYIQWNGDMCADYTGWYWEGRWKKNMAGTNQVTLKAVAAGALDLSMFTTAFYMPPP